MLLKMEEIIKQALKTKTLTQTGRGGGGCISQGEGYSTDHGVIFVKRNSDDNARQMFDSEYEGLKAIRDTGTVRVPKPLVVLDDPKGGAVLIMEYIEMSPLRNHSSRLGEELARLHMYNESLLQKDASSNDNRYVDKFGFHCTTCCGRIPQDNTWCDDWVTFFTRQKLLPQVNMILKQHKDSELQGLWSRLERKIPEFFEYVQIQPALLHGDLWGGNAAETSEGPVIFDPATFYGHSEFDLAIAKMFGGFSRAFFDAYHKIIPKTPGFEVRHQLYQLFHYLNHWNHFGSGYRGSSLSIMRKLIEKT